VTGEQAGLPSVAIMTEQFVSAAELMGAVLGASGYPFITIEHPVSSAAPAQLALRARAIAPEVVRHLTRGDRGT
jgi:hypothetical protein